MNKLIILPYKFKKLDDKILITNSCGETLFLSETQFSIFRSKPDECDKTILGNLKSRFFVVEETEKENYNKILRIKYETKHSYLADETLLLMVVPTIACNCNCVYCQVSSKKTISERNDMSFKTASAFCSFVFALPHKEIKIEFQGGEPSLRMDIIEYIVRKINLRNIYHRKVISYVICTNLISISHYEVSLLKKYHIGVSTSLDGPKKLHELNRPIDDKNSSYELMMANVFMLRNQKIYPSALVTITKNNIDCMHEIIDEYIKRGFQDIFIRPLNNYGYAFSNESISYSIDNYIEAYIDAVRYIINKNIHDRINIREIWFRIILKKIFSPFNDGFVDMQNPCALGKMCMIVTQHGDVYPSDESRMISEMGDSYWKMGNINNKNCFIDMQNIQQRISNEGILENYNECKECVYSPFCYADPIKKYYIANYSSENYCGIRKRIFDFVFTTISNADVETLSLFRKWANE